ncbi:MAG: hypothetical protein IJK23_10960 [Clostridia bacterium]|nr:hypothetical protein [Clostridia bacterium]
MNHKKLWICSFAVLIASAVTAYVFSVYYITWNVPLYGVGIALIFLCGAAAFALPSIAKHGKSKRAIVPAILGGLCAVAGVFAITFFINNILMHEHGARLAAVFSAVFGFLFALIPLILLKKRTKGVPAAYAPIGVVLALLIPLAGIAGTLPKEYFKLYGKPDTQKAEAQKAIAAAEEKLYGSDAFKDEDGTLTVAFIGGSLTDGRITYKNGAAHSENAWTENVIRFLENKYPKKTVRAVNAGKGGTTSQYAASRFGYDIEPYAPDLLFIEYSVNDSGAFSAERDEYGAAETQKYLEYMLRRCLDMKKEPAVIYLHTPYPTEDDSELYALWRQGVDLKNTLCAYYGVPTVNIYDAIHQKYKAADPGVSFCDWLLDNGWYRPAEGGGIDVHPNADGYRAVYSSAVLDALETRWDEMIRQPLHREIYCKNDADFLNDSYSYVECGDQRISYQGAWEMQKNHLLSWYLEKKDEVPRGFFTREHFANGVMQTKSANGACFFYETDASEIGMAVVSSLNGLAVEVFYVDDDGTEVPVGELSCHSVYGAMDFPAGSVRLPADGKTRKVIFRVAEATDEEYLFRFGYIIEFRGGTVST